MIASIERSKGVGLRKALIGFAIPMASEGTAAKLCRAGYASLEAIADATEEELQQVEDVGPKVAASLHQHLNRPGTRDEIAALREHEVNLDVLEEDLPPKVVSGAPLEGKTVVVTGSIADPRSGEKVPRPVFQRLCERAGATTASSVSANTDMLITGADVGASKLAKAEKLEVEVVDQARDLEAADRGRGGLSRSGQVRRGLFDPGERGAVDAGELQQVEPVGLAAVEVAALEREHAGQERAQLAGVVEQRARDPLAEREPLDERGQTLTHALRSPTSASSPMSASARTITLEVAPCGWTHSTHPGAGRAVEQLVAADRLRPVEDRLARDRDGHARLRAPSDPATVMSR